MIRFPVNRVLHAVGTTIVSNYYKLLQDYATTQPLLDYIQEQQGWDSDTLSQVDWKVLANVCEQNSQ
eukprot:416338-Ditylum_brightwellii.AAC.1